MYFSFLSQSSAEAEFFLLSLVELSRTLDAIKTDRIKNEYSFFEAAIINISIITFFFQCSSNRLFHDVPNDRVMTI